VNDSKEWLDAGYLDSNIKGQWNDDWNLLSKDITGGEEKSIMHR